jgi:hypothetical protein
MKKFDIRTRQGRARRRNRDDIFNPDSLQPHHGAELAMRQAAKTMKKMKKKM